MKFKALVLPLIALALLGSTACQKKNSSGETTFTPANTTPDPDFVTYEKMDFSLKKDIEISPQKRNIVQALSGKRSAWNGGRIVSFSEITKQFISLHNSENQRLNNLSENPEPAIQSKISEIAKVLNFESPGQFKVQYEGLLETRTQKISYNSLAMTLPDVIFSKILQCYSGTSLYQVLLRQNLRAQEFRKKNAIVIFTTIQGAAHIMPGFIQQPITEDSAIIGIETTASGTATRSYGTLKQPSQEMIILDAELWMLYEVLKDLIEDPQNLAEQLLAMTDKKYPPLKQELKSGNTWVTSGSGQKQISSSAFSFGSEPKTINKPREELPGDVPLAKPEPVLQASWGGSSIPIRNCYVRVAENLEEFMKHERVFTIDEQAINFHCVPKTNLLLRDANTNRWLLIYRSYEYANTIELAVISAENEELTIKQLHLPKQHGTLIITKNAEGYTSSGFFEAKNLQEITETKRCGEMEKSLALPEQVQNLAFCFHQFPQSLHGDMKRYENRK